MPAPRIGLAGSETFNRPAPIDLKLAQEGQALDVGPEVFLPLSNDQGNPFDPVLIPGGPKRHGCGKKKNVVMAKMDEFSRFFRNLFGFAPIEEFGLPIPVPDHAAERHRVHSGHRMMAAHVGSDEDNNFHILPFMPGPVQGEGFPPPRSEGVSTPLFPGRLGTPEEKPSIEMATSPFTSPIYILTLFPFYFILFYCQSPCSNLRHRCGVIGCDSKISAMAV